MTSADLLVDAFGRVRDAVHAALEDLSAAELSYRVDDDANTIAWLVWHLTRVQDDHVAAAMGLEQVAVAQGFEARLALPFPPGATGYDHDAAEVAEVTVADGSLLRQYYDAVHQQSVEALATLTDGDLERIVDRRWDPPVTLGVRLISVLDDDLEHAGQAGFLRGVVLRRR